MLSTRSCPVRLGGAFVLVASISACGNDKGPPSQPGSVATFVTSLSIVGPESVEPGSTAQYAVELRLNNDTTERADEVRWHSSNPSVLAIDGQGQATAGSGWSEVTLTADARLPGSSGSRQVSRTIMVHPAGTFRLVGIVTDADIPGFAVFQARIEVRRSPDLSAPIETYATTDGTGAYKLYGVPGSGYLHVRKPGYMSTTEPFELQAHGRRDLTIRLEEARLSLDGAYTMDVEATQCGGFQALPPELRHRRYEAVMTDSGGRLTVKLRGAAFYVDANLGDGFTGIATPTGALVQIPGFYDFYYYPEYPRHPALAEILPDGTVLVVNGQGTLTGTRERLSGPISGWVIQYEAPAFPSAWRFVTGCSNGTVVTLTRR